MKRFTLTFFLIALIVLSVVPASAHIPVPESERFVRQAIPSFDDRFERDLGVKYPSMSWTAADWIRWQTPRRYAEKGHVPGIHISWVICHNNPVNRVDLDGRVDFRKDPSGFSDMPMTDLYREDPLEIETRYDSTPITRMGPEVTKGTLQAMSGFLETTAGVSLCVTTGWTGVGAVGGGFVAAHGLDSIQAGFRQCVTRKEVDTLTSEGLQKIGMSRTAANLTDAGISFVGSFSAGTGSASIKLSRISQMDDAAGLTKLELLSKWERGSSALPNKAFNALGGELTSPLAKCILIESGAVSIPQGVHLFKASSLYFTGLTPMADLSVPFMVGPLRYYAERPNK